MSFLISQLFFVLWFFFPAGLANAAPVLASKISFLEPLDYPLDFHLKFRGKRIFGENKTIRGLICGTLVGIVTVVIEMLLYSNIPLLQKLIPLPYSSIDPFLLGFLLGFGSLAGDAIKSFFKRQLNIPSGHSWFPFDQLDYIIGGIVFTYVYVKLSLLQYILLIIVWFFIHPITTAIAFVLKLKKSPI